VAASDVGEAVAGSLAREGRTGEGTVGGEMFPEQLVHPAVECIVVAARPFEIGRAGLGRVQFEGFKKDFPFGHEAMLFARGRSAHHSGQARFVEKSRQKSFEKCMLRFR
jgi:hypothetical protein